MRAMNEDTSAVTVAHALPMHAFVADSGMAPITVELQYDPTDPYAVAAVFHGDDDPVRWLLGRDLLHDGTRAATGRGDVHVWPSVGPDGSWVVVLELSSPDGRVMVQAERDAVEAFLEESSRVVPYGAEPAYCDVDGLIAGLLASSPGDPTTRRTR
jgi:hypothetical protein